MKTFVLPFGIEVTVDGGAGSIRSGLRAEVTRRAADVIESLVLAHACAGVEIDSPAYVAGLESALEAIANN